MLTSNKCNVFKSYRYANFAFFATNAVTVSASKRRSTVMGANVLIVTISARSKKFVRMRLKSQRREISLPFRAR